MISKLYVFEGLSFDPYYNLAVEKYLLETVAPDACILYLWQNENTVVIGRNQNPWAECSIAHIEEDSVKLARRLSGGGAVFHDLGNLNFTFLVTEDNYDLDRQLSVIETMCRSFGIDAVRSGRNDILVDGKKFSGNAFYNSKGRSYHHGTLLIDADMQKMPRYLNPSKAKLTAKGVASVRSRVTNLKDSQPALNVAVVKQAMVQAFSSVYGLDVEFLSISEKDGACILEDAARMGDWNWLYGTPLPCTFSCQEKFEWGEITCNFDVASGVIQHSQVFTDAMDWAVALELEKSLLHCRFTLTDIRQAIQCANIQKKFADDILNMLAENL